MRKITMAKTMTMMITITMTMLLPVAAVFLLGFLKGIYGLRV